MWKQYVQNRHGFTCGWWMYHVVCETHFIAQTKRLADKLNYLLNSICVVGFRVEPTAPFHPAFIIWWQYLLTCDSRERRVSRQLTAIFIYKQWIFFWLGERLFNRFSSYYLGDLFLVCFGFVFVFYFWHIASFSVVSCGFLIRCFDWYVFFSFAFFRINVFVYVSILADTYVCWHLKCQNRFEGSLSHTHKCTNTHALRPNRYEKNTEVSVVKELNHTFFASKQNSIDCRLILFSFCEVIGIGIQSKMLNLRSMLSRLTIRPAAFYRPMQCIHTSEVDLRARKGTREKREKLKKKIKAEKLAKITKVGSITYTSRKM